MVGERGWRGKVTMSGGKVMGARNLFVSNIMSTLNPGRGFFLGNESDFRHRGPGMLRLGIPYLQVGAVAGRRMAGHSTRIEEREGEEKGRMAPGPWVKDRPWPDPPGGATWIAEVFGLFAALGVTREGPGWWRQAQGERGLPGATTSVRSRGRGGCPRPAWACGR